MDPPIEKWVRITDGHNSKTEPIIKRQRQEIFATCFFISSNPIILRALLIALHLFSPILTEWLERLTANAVVATNSKRKTLYSSFRQL
jgi:hypothetical protein